MTKVIIYGRSTPVCPMCNMAKSACDMAGMPYTYYDMAAREWSPQDIMEKYGISPRTLPVISVDGEILQRGVQDLQEVLRRPEPEEINADEFGDSL